MNNTNKNNNSLIISSTDGTINAFINGKAYILSSGSYYYPAALAAAKERNYEKLVEAIDLDKAVKSKSNGKVTFEDGVLRYNGAKIDNKLSRRVLELVGEGYKLDPFIKFMELCYQNPNPTVIDNLYDFMETTGIMLDEEGWVVGWKKVREDGYDYYSGTVLYEVGETVKMDRGDCNNDSRNSCAPSLHTGSRNYAENLWYPGQGKLLVVRVNPKNVVCVPEYSGWEKLRACEMDVLEEFQVDREYKAIYVRLSSEDTDNFDYDDEVDLNEVYSAGHSNSNYNTRYGSTCSCHYEECEESEDWTLENEKEYNQSWSDAILSEFNSENAKGKVASNSDAPKRDSSGRFIKGTSLVSKIRDSHGRFVKNA